MNQQVFFKLFACCIPVKGASRTALYDLQRNSFEYIPNILYDLIQECKQFSAAELQLRYPASAWQGISKFLDYLEENEYGFWTSTPECFPDMSLEWDFPGKISNAIIEFVPEKVSMILIRPSGNWNSCVANTCRSVCLAPVLLPGCAGC